jgi:hypothetical protein
MIGSAQLVAATQADYLLWTAGGGGLRGASTRLEAAYDDLLANGNDH